MYIHPRRSSCNVPSSAMSSQTAGKTSPIFIFPAGHLGGFAFLRAHLFSKLNICSIAPILTSGVQENSGAGLSNEK